MLLADSSLAEVQLRYADRYRAIIPRLWRLCRFCLNEIEDPPHAMFGCNGSSELVSLRTTFLNTVFSMSGSLHCAALSATPASFLSLVLAHRPLSDILAKFAYDTLQIFEKTEMYIADYTLYHNDAPAVILSNSMPRNSML